MKTNKLFLTISICGLLILLSSCSQVLNLMVVPFAPTFIPTVDYDEEDGAIISYEIDTEKKVDKDESRNWKMGYAYYIWRSTTSPYADYELIARIYNSDAINKYEGFYKRSGEDTEYKTYDFTIPKDGRNVPCATPQTGTKISKGVYVDSKARSTLCYYRVTKVTVESSYYKSESDDKTVEKLAYSLNTDTSGWCTAGEE